MPYKDPHKRRENARQRAKARYHSDPVFRKKQIALSKIKMKIWREKYPERAKEQRLRHSLRVRYRLPLETLQQMSAQQGGLCAICEMPCRYPTIDHNHETGLVRGLLCNRCNIRLSGIEDAAFRAKAEKYLS